MFREIWIQLLQCVGTIAREIVTKHATLIWTNWNSNKEPSGPSWITSSSRQSFVSGVVDSSRSLMPVLYNFSCNIFYTRLSNGLKSGEFRGHSQGGINSRVFFSNNSVVARLQWAFQISQRITETSLTSQVKLETYTSFWMNEFILQQIYLGNYLPNIIGIDGVL